MITRIGFKVDEKGIKKGQKLIGGFKKAAKVAVLGITAGLLAIGVGAIKAASDMEMLTTQFEVMLGSTEKANEMMRELKIFSAATPFQIKDLAQGTQNLLAFGVSENVVIDRMRMLGDTAKGNSEMLKGLVLAYGKVQVKGKASMEELNMIAEKGIPIYTVLMDQIGVKSKEAFFKMVSAGKIGKEEITKAFQTMTSEGGLFFKGMEKASLTLAGMISTMKDNFTLLLAEIGQGLLPVIKEFVGVMTELAKGPLKEIGVGLSAVLVPIFQALGKILPKIIKFLVPILEVVGNIIGKLLIGLLPILDLLEPLLVIVQELMPLLEVIVELIVLLIPLIVFVLKIVIKLMTLFIKPMLRLMTRALRLVTKITDKVIKGLKKIKDTFKEITSPIKKVIDKIGDFFRDMWNTVANSVNKAIEAFNKLSPGKRFDIQARLPTLTGTGAAMTAASGKAAAAAAAGKPSINAPMDAKIKVDVHGGPGGASPQAIGEAVGKAIRSKFGLELKKVIISAV